VWEGQGSQYWGSNKYHGQFRGGKAHGYGQYIGGGGNRYIGAWQDGKAHGYGEEVQQCACASRSYKGEWQADRPHGKGIEVYFNGDRYEGEFRNGMRYGDGHFLYSSKGSLCPCPWTSPEYGDAGNDVLAGRLDVLKIRDNQTARAPIPSGKKLLQPVAPKMLPPDPGPAIREGAQRKNEVFAVVVTRVSSSGGPVGLDLDLLDGESALVVDVTPGVLHHGEGKVNRTGENHFMQEHDRILEVNGARGVVDLVARLKEDSVWNLLVQRPLRFTVQITKGKAASLGLELCHADNGTSLLISKVLEGPMQDWNASHPELRVKTGDRIVGVNGIRGPAELLLRSSKGESNLTFEINSYSSMQDVNALWTLSWANWDD
jgi:hypothetical protein